MSYKVFFVEDEIITPEGIRDNINWHAHGFEFCGEAADGEMALSLLRVTQPDVLITDIKMPFMDGLQLSKIVRERMPWVKIVILSVHELQIFASRLPMPWYTQNPADVSQGRLNQSCAMTGSRVDIRCHTTSCSRKIAHTTQQDSIEYVTLE